MEDRNAAATKSDIANLEMKIGNLDQKVGSLDPRVDRLEQKVDRLQVDMELHRSEVNHRFDDSSNVWLMGKLVFLKRSTTSPKPTRNGSPSSKTTRTPFVAAWQPSKTEC